MPDNNNIRKVYDALSAKYTNMAQPYEEFESMMGDEQNRRKVYDALSKKYTKMAQSWEEFNSMLAPTVPEEQPLQPTAQPAAQQPQAPVAPQQPVEAQAETETPKRKKGFIGEAISNMNWAQPGAPAIAPIAKEDTLRRKELVEKEKTGGEVDQALVDMADEERKAARQKKITSWLRMIGPEAAETGPRSISVEQAEQEKQAAEDYTLNKLVSESLDEAVDYARAAKDEKGLGAGIVDTASRIGTWDFGYSDIVKGATLNNLIDKYESGEPLSEQEDKALDMVALATYITQMAQDGVGIGYKVGQSLPQSLGFMASIALNPASNLGVRMMDRAAKKYGEKGLKALTVKLLSGGARAIGDVAEMATATVTTGGGRTLADAIDRINGSTQYEINPDGTISYGGQAEQAELGEAAKKAFTNNFIENYTEALGEYFSPLAGMLGNLTDKSLRKVGFGTFADFLNSIPESEWGKMVRNFKEATKFNGILGEVLEEEIGMVMEPLTVGDSTLGENFAVWSKNPETRERARENQLVTILSCALMSGAIYGVESLGARKQIDRGLRQADRDGYMVFPVNGDIQWNDIKQRLSDSKPEELVRTMKDIVYNPSLDVDQRKAIVNYAARLMQSQQFNTTTELAREEMTETSKNLLAAYDAGYRMGVNQEPRSLRSVVDAMINAQTGVYALNIQDIAQQAYESDAATREQILAGLGAEERKAVEYYLGCKERFDGMNDGLDLVVTDQMDAATAYLLPAIRQAEDGSRFIESALTADGRNVFVVGGEGAMAIILDEQGNKETYPADQLEGRQISDADQTIKDLNTSIEDEFRARTDFYEKHNPQTQDIEVGMVIGDGNQDVIVTDMGEGWATIVEATTDDEGNPMPKKDGHSRDVTKEYLLSLQDDIYDRRDRMDGIERADEAEAAAQMQGPDTSASALLAERAQQWAAATGVNVRLIERAEDITNSKVLDALAAGKSVTGWYDASTGDVCFYLPNLNDVAEMDRTFIHEVVGHKGMRLLLGEAGYDELCQRVWDELMDDAARQEMLSKVQHLSLDDAGLQRAAADEFIAYFAEQMQLNPTDENRTVWERIVQVIKDILDRIGLGDNLTTEDLSQLLQASLARFREEVAEEQKTQAESQKAPTALESIPTITDKEGNVEDYAWSQAPDAATALAAMREAGYSDEDIRTFADTQAKELKKKGQALEKKAPKSLPQQKAKREAIEANRLEQEFWNSVIEAMDAEIAMNQAEKESLDAYGSDFQDILDAVNQMIDETDFESMVAFNAARSKYIWADSNHGTKGFSSHMFAARGNKRSEQMANIGWLANRDKGGKYPEEVAERIFADLPDGIKEGHDEMEALDIVIDTIRTANHPATVIRDMYARLIQKQEEDALRYQQEQEEEERRQADAYARDFGFASYEDMTIFEELWASGEDIVPLSDEDIQEIDNLIAQLIAQEYGQQEQGVLPGEPGGVLEGQPGQETTLGQDEGDILLSTGQGATDETGSDMGTGQQTPATGLAVDSGASEEGTDNVPDETEQGAIVPGWSDKQVVEEISKRIDSEAKQGFADNGNGEKFSLVGYDISPNIQYSEESRYGGVYGILYVDVRYTGSATEEEVADLLNNSEIGILHFQSADTNTYIDVDFHPVNVGSKEVQDKTQAPVESATSVEGNISRLTNVPEGVGFDVINARLASITDDNRSEGKVYLWSNDDAMTCSIMLSGKGLKKFADYYGFEYEYATRMTNPAVFVPVENNDFGKAYDLALSALDGSWKKKAQAENKTQAAVDVLEGNSQQDKQIEDEFSKLSMPELWSQVHTVLDDWNLDDDYVNNFTKEECVKLLTLNAEQVAIENEIMAAIDAGESGNHEAGIAKSDEFRSYVDSLEKKYRTQAVINVLENKTAKQEPEAETSAATAQKEVLKPFDEQGNKTWAHPEKLREAYESGNKADIAKAEKAVGDFIDSSNSLKTVEVTVRSYAQRKKKAKKDSAERRMAEFVEKRCKARAEQLNKLYVASVKKGDIDTALMLLREKALATPGITIFAAPNNYGGSHRDVALLIKKNEGSAIEKAAADMARFVPSNAVLIPMPPHEGKVTDDTDTMLLAKAISDITGCPVVAALEGDARESRYQAKQRGEKGPKAKDLGFRRVEDISMRNVPVFIDNVVDSGETAKAASDVIPGGFTLSYAKGNRSVPTEGLKNMAVTYDDNGDLIPLSKRFDAENPDIRFRQAEDRASLMGAHNISEDKLKKALKQGGLANPSMAIVDTDKYIHQGYGDISLIPYTSTLDASRKSGVMTYSGDAYSPSYPTVRHQLTGKGEKKIDAMAARLAKGDKMLENYLSSRLYNYVEENGTRLAGVYLADKGFAPSVLTEQGSHTHEEYEAVKDIIERHNAGNETEEDYKRVLDILLSERLKDVEEHEGNIKGENLKKAYRKHAYDDYKERITDQNGKLNFSTFDSYLYGVRHSEGLRNNPRMDYSRMDSASLDEVIKRGLTDDYWRWVENLFTDEEWPEVLFNGWTPDGHRKYIPNTLQNASRIMNKQADNNADDWNGWNATRSLILKKMRTLSDIRRMKEQLRSKEDYEKEIDGLSEEWHDLVSNLSGMQKIDDNPFSNMDYAENRLQEAILEKDPVGYLNKEYGYDIAKDGEFAKDLEAAVKEMKAAPAKYFESKFSRPVYLSEFKYAIVPKDIDADVRKGLEDAGLTLSEYERKDPEDFISKVRQTTEGDSDVRFREANLNQEIFVSNAQRAVENIKQVKATPQQWLAMIQKSGGIKAGEDKWLRLSQWLQEQTAKTLTKQEVLDYIGANKIQIEEQRYSENPTESQDIEKMYPGWYEAFWEDVYEGPGNYTEIEWRVKDLQKAVELYNANNSLALHKELDENGDITDDEWDEILDWAKEAFEEAPVVERGINSVRLGYTTEGLKNKREIALFVPTIDPWNEDDNIHFGDAGSGRAVAWIRFGDTNMSSLVMTLEERKQEVEEARQRSQEALDRGVEGRRRRDEEQNILNADAEIERLNRYLEDEKVNNKRVLVIDEIQSKRHQEGRERGYETPEPTITAKVGDYEYKGKLGVHGKEFAADIIDADNNVIGRMIKSEYEMDGNPYLITYAAFPKEGTNSGPYQDEQEALKAMFGANKSHIPSAPFEKNWQELAMKRMLRLAAEEGYDRIAWTTGEQQAERYDLGKFIDNIYAAIDVDGNRSILLHPVSGRTIDITHDDQGNILKHNGAIEGLDAAKNISELVGKEIAQDILQITEPGTANGREYDGHSLRVGTSGMKAFYDKMLVNFMNKYGRQWGVQVEDIEMPDLNEGNWDVEALPMHSVRITPEMKRDVMEGQVMFREANDKNKQPGKTNPDITADADVMFRLSNRDRETIAKWLEKRNDLTAEEKTQMLNYFDTFEDKKLQLAAGWWFAKGTVRFPEDMPKVEQAVKVSTLAKVDPLQYSSPMELINEHAGIEVKGKRINPDDVKTLSNKRELTNGITIYDVEDSEESRRNMREIINTHFGKKSSPWCLLQGDSNGELTSTSAEYWGYYNGYTKQVAFQDGKLIAFSANRGPHRLWWDRQDQAHDGIPALGKIPGDKLGRSGTTVYNASTGQYMGSDGPYYKGNKENGEYTYWEERIGKPVGTEHYKNGKKDGVQEYWFRNGQRREKSTYVNGVRDGLFQRWYDNGQEQERVIFTNGNPDSKQVRWWSNGQIEYECTYVRGVAVGEESFYNPNGSLRERNRYDDRGWRQGLQEVWHSTGKLAERSEYKDGEANGLFEKWTNDGKLIKRVNYKHDKIDGLYEEWYEDGKKKRIEHYKDDVLDGLRETFDAAGYPATKYTYKNGEWNGPFEVYYFTTDKANPAPINIKGTMKDGRAVGLFERFYDNGQIAQRNNYNSNSIEDGVQESWYTNGQLHEHHEYKKGLLDGVSEEYDEEGRLLYREYYKNGELVNAVTEENQVRFREVTDPLAIEALEASKKQKGYRTVTVNDDGTFGSPMAGRLGKKGEESKSTSSFRLGAWEEAEENPDMATDDGKVNLIKPGGRGSVGGVDYNPYIHIRPTSVNKQFTQAWTRPELAYIETEYPERELTSGYKADKAKLPVGRHSWNGGELILSRWDKPTRIMPWEEVADEWAKEFKNSGVTFDIVSPHMVDMLADRGVKILPPKKAAGKAAMDAYNRWKNGRGPEGGIRFRITPEMDAEYEQAYKAGDEKKAMQMVKDAFKAKYPNTKVVDGNGEPMVVYHGTRHYRFNAFAQPGVNMQGLIWTAKNKKYAQSYASPDDEVRMYEDEFGDANVPQKDGIYRLFVNIENPVDLGNIEEGVGSDTWDAIAKKFNLTPKELFDRIGWNGAKYEDSIDQDDPIYELTREDKFVNLLNEYGYDGVTAREGGPGVGGTFVTYGAVSGNQVKSAEPFTLDDEGNLIPLSERFKENNWDIRFRQNRVNEAMNALFGNDQLSLFGQEEMKGGVDNSKKKSIFASNSQDNGRTETKKVQTETAAASDRTADGDVQREGDSAAASRPKVSLKHKKASELIKPLRKLRKGETCLVERKMTEDKNFSFIGPDKIETSADVAYIFKELENKAIENAFLVFKPKGNAPAYVLHIGMGTMTSATVDLTPVLPMINSINPERIWLVHNHPSGSVRPSIQDKGLLLALKTMVDVYSPNVEVEPGIIIDTKSGVYGMFNELGWKDTLGELESSDIERKAEYPVYKFDEQAFSKDYKPDELEKLLTSADVAKFVATHRLGERAKINILVLDQAAHVVGNFFSDVTDIRSSENRNRLIGECVNYMSAAASSNVIIFGTGIPNALKDPEGRSDVTFLRQKMRLMDMGLLEVISIDEDYANPDVSYTYYSYADHGMMEPEIKYGKVEDSELDAEYEQAYKDGDEKKAMQMVKDAFKAKYPDTKVVDENGEPMVVYHGTDLDIVNQGKPFYKFYNDSHFGTWEQARDRWPIDKTTIYRVYLNIENPKRVNDMPGYWKGASSEYWEPKLKKAKEEGYDGIVYENLYEGSENADSYIAFEPNQIKSAEPFTFDDSGNLIPLSKRFDSGSNDIRFRASDGIDDRRENENAREFTLRLQKEYRKQFNEVVPMVVLGEKKITKPEMKIKLALSPYANINKIYDIYDKESFADDKIIPYGWCLSNMGIDKTLIFAKERVSSARTLLGVMIHENVHAAIVNGTPDQFSNAAAAILKYYDGIYKDIPEENWARNLYRKLQAIPEQNEDNEIIAYVLGFDILDDVDRANIKAYAAGDKDLMTFFEDAVNKIHKTDDNGKGNGRGYESQGGVAGGSEASAGEVTEKEASLQQAEAATDTAPTEGQKEAGNYKHGHTRQFGMDLSIENPEGSTRSGVDADGKTWSQVMNNTYGYIRGTMGRDKDHIDFFLGPNLNSDKVYIIDQRNVKTGAFDEHKVMLGFDDIEQARDAYNSNYEEGWQGLGAISELSLDDFKEWAFQEGRRVQPYNNDIRFRERDEKEYQRIENILGTAAARYERSMDQMGKRLTEVMQDSLKSVDELQKAIEEETGKPIRDFENAYWAAIQYSSRNKAMQEAYHKLFYRPLMDEVSKLVRGQDDTQAAMDELTAYLLAKHGLERNEVFARRDAKKEYEEWINKHPNSQATEDDFYQRKRRTDYSGLTALTMEPHVEDAENLARIIVDNYESNHDTAELWKRINAATKETLRTSVQGGVLSQDKYNELATMFQNYVPLRGFDETTSDDVYGYYGTVNSPYNTAIKKAYGRRSLADSPLATIANIADSEIMRANRNRIYSSALSLAENHRTGLMSISEVLYQRNPQTGLWEISLPQFDKNDTPEEVAQKMAAHRAWFAQQVLADPMNYRTQSEMANVPYKVISKSALSEHQILATRGGKQYIITVNGNPRAAQALAGKTNPDSSPALQWLAPFNRFLASVFTQYNPSFVLANLTRDGIYTNSMVWAKESPKYARNYNKNWGRSLTNMASLLSKYKKGTLDDNEPIERYFKEFIDNGGETGYTQLRSVKDYKKIMKRELKDVTTLTPAAAGRKVMTVIGDAVENMNRWAEGVSRFAAYLTSREQGRSVVRSVEDAKEISVNFNKKGSGVAAMTDKDSESKLLMNVARASQLGRELFVFFNAGVQGMANAGGVVKNNPEKAAALMAGLFLGGMALAMMNGGDGDDDDEKDYYNLPEYIRRSNICIKAGDHWITIPLPIELRALYGLGELAYSVMTGNEYYEGKELAYEVASQLSQILPIDFLEGNQGTMAFIPSSVKPLAEAYWLNQDWTGSPIYNKSEFNEFDPAWRKAYKSTSPVLVAATRGLSNLTGGNVGRPGVINLNPARIEHLFEGYLGGVGTILNQAYKTVGMAWDEDLREMRNVPVVSRFVKDADDRAAVKAENARYHKVSDYVDEVMNEDRRLRQIIAEKEIVGYDYDEQVIRDAEKRLNELRESKEWEFVQEWKALDKARTRAREGRNEEDFNAITKQMNDLYKEYRRKK